MKIVLTESQANFIHEQYMIGVLSNSINEGVDKNQIVSWVKRAMLGGATASMILAGIAKSNMPDNEKRTWREKVIEFLHLSPDVSEQEDNTLSEAMIEKIEATKQCMSAYLNGQGKTLDDIELSPEEMVKACEKYNFSLPFMLAQGWVESWFGLGSRCSTGTDDTPPTHSVWSIGSWDNKTKAFYSNDNEGIIPYIQTIQGNYLVNGKTYKDLLKKGGFVNGVGNRYAKDPHYESKVRNTMNSMIKKFPKINM